MKKVLILAALFLCFSFNIPSAHSVEEPEQLTDQYMLDLINNSSSQLDYPGIAAVYLLMDEKDYVNEDATAIYDLHIVWKILDRQAMPLGEVNIPFNASESTLEIVSARTIKPDKTVVNVSKENIREVTPYSGFPLYSNIRLKQFSMPAMEVGCVVEYKARLKVFKPKLPGFFFSYWSFPPGLPVEKSVFEINVPKDVETGYVSNNLYAEPEITESGDRKIYKWIVKDIFIEGIYEQFLPPYDVVCPNLTFAAKKTWDEIAKWFYDISKPQLEPSQEMEAFVAFVVEEQGGDKEKIMKWLYDFVSQAVRYVAIPLKSSDYQPHKVSEIYTNKYGDCKDKSALLISLYKMVGIDADFALVKTRSAGPLIKDFPVLDFNHCIVAVPKKVGGYIFLDPTLELNKFGYLTTEMQDVDIFVVKKDDYEFVKVPFAKEVISGSLETLDMKIDDDYVIHITNTMEYFGDTEIGTRLNFKYSTKDAIRAFFGQVISTIFTNAKLNDVNFSDPSNLNERFKIVATYEARNHIKEAGKLLIFDLPAISISALVSTEDRVHPIWLPGLSENTTIVKVSIPPGCKINYLPENVEKDTPFGYYRREVSARGDIITMTYTYKSKKLIIPPDQYRAYKEFVEFSAKNSKESIVFEIK
ncbi:MAG: DUF3857 domain-containing protein [Candidatus Omnitrophica bacterium]|nr:DUF3857 domain-containing protein [Candidatus Omnitrophota bacterium]